MTPRTSHLVDVRCMVLMDQNLIHLACFQDLTCQFLLPIKQTLQIFQLICCQPLQLLLAQANLILKEVNMVFFEHLKIQSKRF